MLFLAQHVSDHGIPLTNVFGEIMDPPLKQKKKNKSRNSLSLHLVEGIKTKTIQNARHTH